MNASATCFVGKAHRGQCSTASACRRNATLARAFHASQQGGQVPYGFGQEVPAAFQFEQEALGQQLGQGSAAVPWKIGGKDAVAVG
ncbi:hypothetical protein [Streptomyces sp. NPDC005407]|uniref:hypothetical protein n=1 Tax=Streptomyces sp. NPDC005407 TaxID=3155340 RepID=UPI0033AF6B6E